MVVLVCPAPFKGVLTAPEAAGAMGEGARLAGVEPLGRPLADGGEGTLEALLSVGGARHPVDVSGPHGEPVTAHWALLPDGTAVVEMAQASGLSRVKRQRNDLLTATTFGTGQLILAALSAQPRALVVGLGGSATNDGGMGALRALGARLWSREGRELTQPCDLEQVDRLDLSGLERPRVPVGVAADVRSPLCGEHGATRIFGPQKGGDAQTLERLERGMRQWERVLRDTLGWDVGASPGAGAAGGLGAALLGVLGATFRPGVDVVMDAIGFDQAVSGADLIITGEGRLDAQSLEGKAIAGVLRRAGGKPVIAVCGTVALERRAWERWGLRDAIVASPERPASTAEAIAAVRRATRAAVARFIAR